MILFYLEDMYASEHKLVSACHFDVPKQNSTTLAHSGEGPSILLNHTAITVGVTNPIIIEDDDDENIISSQDSNSVINIQSYHLSRMSSIRAS